jgi:hypothetical protein
MSNPPTSPGGFEITQKTALIQRLPPPVPHQQPPLPQQRVLLAQQHNDATVDLTVTPLVTWHDQQQLHDAILQLPAPQQRVEIEQLQDEPARLHPTTPTTTGPNSQLTPVLPPPPWTSYDVASASGTALTLPSDGPAFRNPNTSHRAANLAARINELEDELLRSRAYYSSTG